LTNIPVVFFLPTIYGQAVGWIAGTIASSVNFWWLSHNVMNVLGREANDSKLASYKFFYFRYLFLAIYSVLIVVTLKPDILAYGLGLVSVQLAIYGNYLYELVNGTENKRDAE